MRPANPLAAWGALICLGIWSGGCAEEGLDREDELTTDNNGRYELVVLDSVRGTADSTISENLADISSDPANSAVFFDPAGEFTVQIGVYRDAAHATTLVRDLKDQGYPAYGTKGPKGMRVRIGYFTNLDDAERFGRIFAADRGVEYWVDKRVAE